MTVKKLISELSKLNPKSQVRFAYDTALPRVTKSIGVSSVEEKDGTVYIIENGWDMPTRIPDGFNKK